MRFRSKHCYDILRAGKVNMENKKREFIINDLITPGFIEHKGHKMLLMELEETGKSELDVLLESDDNLLIANVDKKKTDILYFQTEKEKSLYKRVDHMIFEWKVDNKWKLHLIEMKGSVGERKWKEIIRKIPCQLSVCTSNCGYIGVGNFRDSDVYYI